MKTFTPALAGLFLILSAAARAAEVEYVPARDYFTVALREIDAARVSVDVTLYLFAPRADQADSLPMKLVQALRRAKDRGVRVRVVLDQGPGPAGPSEEPSDAQNGAARDLLAAAGVPVFLDDPSIQTHAKALVVDGETVLLGSTNWTYTAFAKNVEANVLIRSTGVARDLLRDLAVAVSSATPAAPPVPVPWDFLVNPDLLGRMVNRNSEGAFDAYLYLVKAGREKQTFTLNTADLAASLGIDSMPRFSYRRQIRRVLRALQKDYGLITLSETFNQDPSVTLLRSTDTATVFVPLDYWDWGWNRRLDFSGKAFYLWSLYYAAASSDRPQWTLARAELARRHHVSPWFVSRGVVALRRAVLLDVAYGELPMHTGPRDTSLYTPRSLYDPQERDRAFAELQKKYGPEKLARARGYAALVYDDADVVAVELLIHLEEEFGPAKIEAAAQMIGAKNPDNPHRNMAYFIGAIRRVTPLAK